MKNLHIKDSYNTWNPSVMKKVIDNKMKDANLDSDPKKSLNRTYESMYTEWALHNVGYYITKPFIKNEKIKRINERCKDVDLNEHIKKK